MAKWERMQRKKKMRGMTRSAICMKRLYFFLSSFFSTCVKAAQQHWRRTKMGVKWKGRRSPSYLARPPPTTTVMKDSAFWSRPSTPRPPLPPGAIEKSNHPQITSDVLHRRTSLLSVHQAALRGGRGGGVRWLRDGASSHLSFADDEKGVSSGPLSDDVLAVFVMCLSGEKRHCSSTMSFK